MPVFVKKWVLLKKNKRKMLQMNKKNMYKL